MGPRTRPVRPLVTALAAAALALGAGALTAATPAAAGGVAPPVVSPRLVVDENFPDPDVLLVGNTYHAYATNSGGDNIQHRTSTNLRTWTEQPDALPELGSWVGDCSFTPGGATDHCVWAPEVTAVDGGYAMYYTARDAASGRQCIGLATSDSPDGPFVDSRDSALVCPTADGGAIDASTYREDGHLYLLWKSDGNCCSKPAIIHLQPLSADGTTLTGPPVELLRNDIAWEGAVVEAPTLVKHDGTYYLYFSANDFGGGNYRTGWATSDNLTGPYTVGDSELMTSEVFGGDVRGPGGQDVVTTRQGDTAILFHGWDPTYSYRGMYAADLTYGADGTPHVTGAAARYEAEDGEVSHARVVDDASASSLQKVGGLDFADSSVTFTVDATRSGPQTLGIRFANGSIGADGKPATSHQTLAVNGEDVATVGYWFTQWGNWQVLEVPVTLHKGSNTVTLTRKDLFAELDVVYLEAGKADVAAPVHPEDLAGATRYEAEDGVVTHARVREDAAASGGAVVGGLDFADSSVAVRVHSEKGGKATLGIRFANGSERGGYGLEATHEVTVDGRDAGQVVYPFTRWGNWNVVEHEVTLQPGWNTVTLTRTSWYAEIDAIDVRR